MRRAVPGLNPLALFSFGMFSLLGSFWIRDLSTALIAVSAYLLAAVVFLPGWRYPLACLGFSAVASMTIVYSTWRGGGRDETEAIVAGLRILVLAVPGSIMAGYVDPARLGDYLAQSLHLPARMVAASTAGIQRFAGFVHTWQELERVRRARGFGPGWNPVAAVGHQAAMSFGLLVHAVRGATQTAIAMDARGFATAQQRTWAEPADWSRADRVAFAVAFGLGLVPVAAHLLG